MTMKSMMDKVMMTVIAADTNRHDDDDDDDDDDEGGDEDDDDALVVRMLYYLTVPVANSYKQRLELVPLLAVTLPVAVEKQ